MLGYKYKEIIAALVCCHGIPISLRHLKKRLRGMNLTKRNYLEQESEISDVIAAILNEVQGSGQCLGYRSMWRKLKLNYGLFVKRDTVLELMWLIDPRGVNRRKAKRLLRRKYSSPGPCYTWHVDGYDKLKPFGFAIHGAIDGFSRRILWLKVGVTNNNPSVIADYYLRCIEQLKCTPRILRCDLRTENSMLKILQPLFRYHCDDKFAGMNSIILGKSTSNQRIEAWWSILRKQNTDWWMSYFRGLRSEGIYHDGNPLHVESLRFCFIKIIQSELDQVMKEWNTHVISSKRNAEGPSGKPDIMFFNPEVYNTSSFGTHVDNEEVDACREVLAIHSTEGISCTPEFVQLVDEIYPNTAQPTTVEEGLRLFLMLTHLLGEL